MLLQELKPPKMEALTFTSHLQTQTTTKQAVKSSKILFGPNMMAFTSPEDLMKNLPKAMANISRAMGGGGALTDSPTLKISMREYEDWP